MGIEANRLFAHNSAEPGISHYGIFLARSDISDSSNSNSIGRPPHFELGEEFFTKIGLFYNELFTFDRVLPRVVLERQVLKANENFFSLLNARRCRLQNFVALFSGSLGVNILNVKLGNELCDANAESIISLIQAGDSRGEEMLYAVFTKGLRYLAIRKLGYEQADECVHDTFIALTQKIKEGVLREPAALLKYARVILERKIGLIYDERRRWQQDVDFDVIATTRPDKAPSPYQDLESAMKTRIMKQGLACLQPREREILVRFYMQEQDQEQIRSEMNLTETQYRLLKSRSKQKLARYASSFLNAAEPQGTMSYALAG